ncbi:MAG: hypothetical protein ACRERE_28095 [Candidatus Entotheonellia bacterium]
MAWEQWIIPAVLLGGVGGLYYLMAKKGISCCGSMMSSGCGRGAETRESPQSQAEAREPVERGEVAPPAPAEPARPRRGTLVGQTNGDLGER